MQIKPILENLSRAMPAMLLCMLVSLPHTLKAAEPIGHARAVSVTVLGSTTVLADTGTLEDATDARSNSLPQGSVVSTLAGEILTADLLHSTTTAGVDQIDSTASLTDLGVSIEVGGIGGIGLGDVITVSVEFIRSEARAVSGGTGSGNVMVDGLSINGLTTTVTGEINQIIPIVGGQVIINEQKSVPGGIEVNALHITVDGVADLVVASSTAALPTE